MDRESLTFDILIVGAGPAGLSAAIRLGQLNQQREKPLSICVLEKGEYVGAHIISGAVLDPKALNELIPDWSSRQAPIHTAVKKDEFYYLTQKRAYSLPVLPNLHNRGNYIIRLGKLCEWLAKEAESLGVNIFPGFSAHELLLNDQEEVIGVQTNDRGLNKEGHPTDHFQPGINLYAKQTIIAEGCRGSLTEPLIRKFKLRDAKRPQSYGIGIKELWKINPKMHQPGTVIHTVGWPLDSKTYGGSFLYHLEENLVAIGLVIGLDYQNPYLDPFQELQRFKHHPQFEALFAESECIGYGARALNEGGYQAIPELVFPGGMLIGCSAGFLNVVKIKGIHTAMKSGMLAAETIAEKLSNSSGQTLSTYPIAVKKSWIYPELYRARNVRPAFRKGLWPGLIYSAIDQFIFRGKLPWTFRYKSDYLSLKNAHFYKPITYAKPDGKISFDKLTQVNLTGVKHDEQQPCHLKLKNSTVPVNINFSQYAGPEQRYCPAQVYEYIKQDDSIKLQINASNCIHCKTCDIKDPTQNIQWTTPEGGDGPRYSGM